MDEAVSREGTPIAADDDLEIVLYETIQYVTPEGRRYLVRHRIYRALNEVGAEKLAEGETSFRREAQRIFLVEAHTVRPDGARVEIADRAAFIKSPQPDEDVSLYTDAADLVVVFPNVTPGCLVRSVVLI